MSNNLFPVPVNTPFFDKYQQLSQPWNLYLKSLGDDLLQANLLKNSVETKYFKYTLNGNVCFCTYYVEIANTSSTIITLPYVSNTAFDINGQVYVPGTKQITIPANIAYIQFWYFISA